MYKLYANPKNGEVNVVICVADNAYIPFAPDNTDYQRFKADLAEGAQLNDAEGNRMTADQIKTFLEGLA